MIGKKLQAIIDQVRSIQVQANPGQDDDFIMDSSWLLQLELVRSGNKDEFSEDDLIEALVELGVDEDDIPSWFEDFASYL